MSSSGLARGPSPQRVPPDGSPSLRAAQERICGGLVHLDPLPPTSEYAAPWVLGTSPRMTQVVEARVDAHLAHGDDFPIASKTPPQTADYDPAGARASMPRERGRRVLPGGIRP